MSRGLTAATVTKFGADHVRPIDFFEMQFDGGTERVHNGLGPIVWGGNTWTGLGELGQIGVIQESDDLSSYRVSFVLHAVDPSSDLVAAALDEDVFERRAILYVGALNADGALDDDPDEYWSGWMSTTAVQDGNQVVLSCESEMAFAGNANGSLFSDEDQQERHAGDVMFEFLSQIQDVAVQWGPEARTVRTGVTLRRLDFDSSTEYLLARRDRQ